MEQPQYNLFHRKRVEQEYARLYEDLGLGLTTWSPLASGLLTGKYRSGVPSGSRAEVQGYEFLRSSLTDTRKNEIVGRLAKIADELDCTPAQLALAWVLKNPQVSTVITGASHAGQITENLQAAEIVTRITPEILRNIDTVVGNDYD